MRKLLITGIAGGQGRLLTRRLLGRWDVLGVDREPWSSAPESVRVHTLDLRKTRFEDIFRTERPDAVVHMAFVRHFRADPATRHQVNVAGTKSVLENCARYGVEQLVVFSSHYVYGALPDNPRYVDEDHPLNASRTFPEIRDLCEVEGLVSTFLWRYPDVATSILRPVNVLGHYTHSAIGSYFKMPVLPTVAGFDPMMQFLHEEDVALAIERTLERRLRGVYNVAGPGVVPLSAALRAIGRSAVPIPEPFAHRVVEQAFRLGAVEFPPAAVDFLKYPCTVDDARFREATDFQPEHPLGEIFESVRR